MNSNWLKTVFVFFVFFSSCTVVNGQKSAQEKMARKAFEVAGLGFERMNKELAIVIAESEKPDSDMNFTAEQVAQLAGVKSKFRALQEKIVADSDNGRNVTPEVMAGLYDQGKVITDEMHDKILVGEQSQYLKLKVFNEYVGRAEGSVGIVLFRFYNDIFNFSDHQRSVLAEIDKERRKKLKEAKERYVKEVKEIEKDSEDKFRAKFTKNQADKFSGVTGR